MNSSLKPQRSSMPGAHARERLGPVAMRRRVMVVTAVTDILGWRVVVMMVVVMMVEEGERLRSSWSQSKLS